jgi:hypothetical protein
MYIKAHPFGYVPRKKTRNRRAEGWNGSLKKIQTIRMITTYELTRRENGKPLYSGRGKNRKLVKDVYHGMQTRTVKHYT